MKKTLETVVKEFGGVEVKPYEVYCDIFRLGENAIQRKGEPRNYKTNPLGIWTDDFKRFHYRIMFEDTFEADLQELQSHKLGLLNGITYFGKRNTAQNASKMYSMIFDLDGVTVKTLGNFLHGAIVGGHYPIPNYIVLSGHGVHLYYVFEFPLNLYPNIKLQLKEFKYKLIERLWNPYTSTIKKPQVQGIYQPFRVIGGKTKDGCSRPCSTAYRINTHPITLSYFNEFVPEKYEIDDKKLYKESKFTLSEAKEKFPDWYNRVVEGNGERKKWSVSPNLYYWWLRKIEEGATFGHRYFCIMTLAIFAMKCDVSKEEALEDAKKLLPFLNTLTLEQPFTFDDIESAFECYDLQYKTFPRKDLEKITAISMPPNKRNGRKRAQHIQIMNFIRDVVNNNTNWRDGNGRKPKSDIVKNWRKEHPSGKKADCIRETGLSKPTVYKWWGE